MALVPRSSLRSLVLLMSHGKPQLSSFFSSSATAATGADAPPAVQPPVTQAPADRPCPSPKLPGAGGPRTNQEETVFHPLPGGPRPRPRPPRVVRDAAGQACPNAPEDPSTYPTPDHGSCSTPEPVSDEPPCGTSEDVKQRDVDLPPPAREGVGHPIPGPPRPPRRTVTDEPVQCAEEHRKYPIPDGSGDEVFSSCSSAIPPPAHPGASTPAAPDVQPLVAPALPDCSNHKPQHEEGVLHPIHGGPPPRPRPRPPRRGAVKDVADKACLNALEDPAYPTPHHGSSSTSEHESSGVLENPLHPLRGPPRRP